MSFDAATFLFKDLTSFYCRCLNVVFYTSVVLQPIVSALVKAARWNSLTNFPA